jgi:predicted DNA-binding transcriptional regulator AlpA
MPRYLTTAEVAALCRTSPETIRFWRYVGKGPQSFKVGRKVLYEAAAVEAWLTEAQQAALTGTSGDAA